MKIVSTVPLSENVRKEWEERYPHFPIRIVKKLEEISLKDVEVFITYGEDLSSEIFDKMSRLKWIACFSAGINKLPLPSLLENGVLVTNARGVHATPMSEFVMATLLYRMKCLEELYEQQIEGIWHQRLPFQELAGKTMLLLGTGSISQEIARKACAFGMTVFGINTSGILVAPFHQTFSIKQFNEILPLADVVVSVLPSTKETRFLFQKEQFERMKNTAIFMNVGRGDLVQSDILLSALNHGQIAHAILDVFEEEPLPKEHPFWQTKNVTITPHVSSHSNRYIPRAMSIFERNFELFLEGKVQEMENKVDLQRGY